MSASYALKFALLKYAQQGDLGLRGNVANLIQQDRSSIGQFKTAPVPLTSPGEGAFLVAKHIADLIQEKGAPWAASKRPNRRRESAFFVSEELGFQEAGRNGCTVQLHERPIAAATPGMNGPCHVFPVVRRNPASAKTSANKSATLFALLSIRCFLYAASDRQNSLFRTSPANSYARRNRDARRILIDVFLR
jgi:hypothetical protein